MGKARQREKKQGSSYRHRGSSFLGFVILSLGLAMVGFGLFFLVLTGQVITLTCTRVVTN